jgi:GNAT superfamily N-acetyltransferase
MAAQDRETFVYLADGVAVGHATLLCQASDPVTGEDFAELLDILVEPTHEVRGITRELVTAAAIRAGQLGRPLVGNVVHAVTEAGHGDRVVASLMKSGWSVAYRYWQRGVGPEED